MQGNCHIRQVAALPYRLGADGDAAPQILLVTSRETKRWVLPKGNPVAGLPLHASAAHEAEEEAGLHGAVCPTALGSYRYRKTRKNGASLMIEVDVYPFAVTGELDEWLEQDERERRWFSLTEAAQSVNEPDLADLIRRFKGDAVQKSWASRLLSPAVENQDASAASAVRKTGESFNMLRWFQALLPKSGDFFGMFERHAATLVAASDALARLLKGGDGMADHIHEIVEREHEADDIIREVLQSVRRTFLTPFDRGAITDLIGSMDDAIDQMQQTAGAIDLYEVKQFEQEMRDMAAIIVDAARILAEALPLLRNIAPNAVRLHELTERLVKMEGDADIIHAAGLKKLFREHGQKDTLHFIVAREIYSHLEKVVDRFEDVANEIDGLVIDHA